MARYFNFLIVVILGAIYYCSNNPALIKSYTEFRYKSRCLYSDKFGYGDLYGMSYLSDYRIPSTHKIHAARQAFKNDIDLYLFCDSYLNDFIEKNHFYGVDSLYKIRWWELQTYKQITSLDKKKRNILVLEIAERRVRIICSNYSSNINMLKIDSTHSLPNTFSESDSKFSFSSFLTTHFFNPQINNNLELNLFDYKIFRPFRELKADFIFNLFNRVNNNVYLDTSKMFLYYMPTVSGEQNENVFFPVDSNEIKLICSTLNKVYSYYIGQGFNEIYLSIIPNTVTMVNPSIGKYNNLIPSLYALDSLRMCIFDVSKIYSNNPQKYYSRNDTHWNSKGLQAWVDNFNKILKKQ